MAEIDEIKLPPTAWKPQKAEARELEELENMDFHDWVAEKKIDGARYALHIRKGGCLLLSTHESAGDGEAVDKTDRVPHITRNPALMAWYKKYHGTVLDGEISLPASAGPSKSKAVTSIMGADPDKAIARQQERGRLVFRVFDILYLHGRDIQEKPQKKRHDMLDLIINSIEPVGIDIRMLQTYYFQTYSDLVNLYTTELKKGGEGLILKNQNMPYVQGSKKASTWIKLKRLGTYDAVVTGYKTGDGKYKGTVGALAISQYLDGKIIQVGFVSGMTDTARAAFATRLHYDTSLPPKKVQTVIPTRWFAIEFLSQEPEKSTHRYRHGRFNQLRPDKTFKDCLFGAK